MRCGPPRKITLKGWLPLGISNISNRITSITQLSVILRWHFRNQIPSSITQVEELPSVYVINLTHTHIYIYNISTMACYHFAFAINSISTIDILIENFSSKFSSYLSRYFFLVSHRERLHLGTEISQSNHSLYDVVFKRIWCSLTQQGKQGNGQLKWKE